MTGASIEQTLELWASSLRDVKGSYALVIHAGACCRVGKPSSWMDCWVTSAARQVGCVLRQPVILVRGGNRPFWAAGAGTRTAGTGIEALVAVEGHRWAIEDSFETAKNEFGLDHNETRSWHGWHRHVSLVMLAFAMMAVIRSRANEMTPPKRLRMRIIQI